MTTITLEVDVLMSSYQTLERVISGKDLPSVVNKGLDMSEYGDVKIGSAVLTATLESQDKIIQGQIESLTKQLATTRAENQRRENAILDKISKLQALEFVTA